jgi:RNA polymerase sigma-70 factor (ECF subfamily)
VDLAQEIFFKAHRHMHAFRGDAKLSTWLYTVTRNHCFSAIRKMAADPVEAGESVPLGLRDINAAQPDHDIERGQLSRLLWQMLDATLDPLEARIMILHYGYEMPLAAITRRLALSNPSGAKGYIVNARRKLSATIRRRALTRDLNRSPRATVIALDRSPDGIEFAAQQQSAA